MALRKSQGLWFTYLSRVCSCIWWSPRPPSPLCRPRSPWPSNTKSLLLICSTALTPIRSKFNTDTCQVKGNKEYWCHMIYKYTVRAPVFGRNQKWEFSTSKHYRKAHGSLLSGSMYCHYTAWYWLPPSSNISILPLQFWQIRFESYWLHCSKCRILVTLRYRHKSL